MHDLLRLAGHLDAQSHDLELALETHLSLVDQVRQTSERAELSLHEVGERAMALESAHGRQWGVEAKIAPERERLFRAGNRLAEVGEELARTSQANLDEVWGLLSRHQEIRRSEAYRQITAAGLGRLAAPPEDPAAVWPRITWARAERQARLTESPEAPLPAGHLDEHGELWLRLLGQDALGRVEPSALAAWSCDGTGRAWQFLLQDSLRNEGHHLALLEVLKASPLPACFPGLSMGISAGAVDLRLPSPYPRLPDFLAGLGLALPIEMDAWERGFRAPDSAPPVIQRLLWIGPSGGGLGHPGLRLVHQWVRDEPHHEGFLPSLPHAGHRLSCPLSEDGAVVEHLDGEMAVRCVGLGADAALVHPLRDRLLAAGAVEGTGGMALCALAAGHAHPEALLLRLFQSDAGLAGASHPALAPYQARLREEVLAAGDPYAAAWSLLEELQRIGWAMPLPPP
jgi:hypothetical protein